MSNGTTQSSTPELAAERQQKIAESVARQRFVRVDELSALLQVSPATIRRDLLELEQQGRLKRVHGGAVACDVLREEPRFDDKTGLAAAEKQAIAEAALRLVQPRDTVYLDGGSTVLALAHLLLPQTALTVVTNSLRVAQLFAAGGPRMILVGGECRRLSQTSVGPLSRPVLDRVSVDLAFMGTIGVSVEDGLTTTDPDEAFTKELAVARSRKVVLLADGSKFGRTSFVRFGDALRLDVLITDAGAPAAELDRLRQGGVEVVIAESRR